MRGLQNTLGPCAVDQSRQNNLQTADMLRNKLGQL